MKFVPIIFLFFCSILHASKLDSLTIEKQKLYVHEFILPQNKNLYIFLHGSVSQFKNKQENKIIFADSLLEGNKFFTSTFIDFGINIVLPIAYNQYNWLDSTGDIFIKQLIEKYKNKHDKIYIGGFSDGATGAYRIFHKNSELFSGLLIFNAFPQKENQHLQTDYKKINNKKIIYVSQQNDEIIPFEFSLVDYRRQKIMNQETYFMLSEGAHEFSKYTESDFFLLLDLVKKPVFPPKNTDADFWIYPPIDALIINNEIKANYIFRKKIGKKYGMNKQEYMSQDNVQKILQEMFETKQKMNFLVKITSKQELETSKTLQFQFISGNNTYQFEIENYLNIDTWDQDTNY